ncbi:MAG: fenitrothion hydrolase [Solirubrobacteraceae bacterium]|nr:fenitrothion hydrolase [Solirubrobacteraceae bacterium]
MPRLIALFTAAIVLALPAAAQAHGLVGRRDLPVPAWLFAWAATAVLLVSFVGLGALWREPRLGKARERRLLSVPAWLEIPFGLLGIALLGLTIYAGFAGIQIDTANWTPTAIFVGLWVGVPFLSLLVGDLYAAINPLRAMGRATGWIAGKVAGDALPAPLVLPERFGRWPAALGLLAFAWVELAFPGRGDPSQLAVLVVLFCLVHGVGMSLYGTEPWISRCDPFAVWFGWVATLAPVRWDRGTLYGRAPTVGTAARRAVPGDAAVVLVAIGTTTWDGLSGGDLLGSLTGDLATEVAKTGLSATWANAFVLTIGMLLAVGFVTGLVFAGTRGMISPAARRRAAAEASKASAERKADRGDEPRDAPGKASGAPTSVKPRSGPPSVRQLVTDFAPALVPIGVAYAVGHYLSLLAFQGQAIPQLLSNPLGRELAPGTGGWLGTAGWTIDYSWLSSNAIWYLQVAALLTGHVASLVLSHDRALERFPKSRAARSQRAMLVVAVIFTCTGLWLLSAV